MVGHFLKIGYFTGCSIENAWEIWQFKIVFGRPNAEIVRKMANGQLLFLALLGDSQYNPMSTASFFIKYLNLILVHGSCI